MISLSYDRVPRAALSENQVNPYQSPRHVALIPDGTRRWARRNRVSLEDGYDKAFTHLSEMVELIFRRGTDQVSLYLLSRENLQRSESDLFPLFTALERFLSQSLSALTASQGAQMRTVGQLNHLPPLLQTALLSIPRPAVQRKLLTLGIAYNPFDELQHALDAARSSSLGNVLSNLWVPEPVDLLIRTSGASLLSNFLPLQSAYANLYFLPHLFNDVKLDHIEEVLTDYENRERYYGT